MSSITAYHLNVKSVIDDDYSFVTIALTWKGKKYLEIPTECERT